MPIGGFGYLQQHTTGKDYVDNYTAFSTDVTSAASVDTFGSWVQLVSDVGDRPIIIQSILLYGGADSTTNLLGVELAIGASSSEVAIFRAPFHQTAIPTQGGPTPAGTNEVVLSGLNIFVPDLSRLSARVKSSRASSIARVGLVYRKV